MSCPACAANVELEQLLAQRDDTISRQRTVIGSLRGQLAAANTDAYDWARLAEALGTHATVWTRAEDDSVVGRVVFSRPLLEHARARPVEIISARLRDLGGQILAELAR